MHELSIAHNIIEIVKENISPGMQVKIINIKLGDLSGVIKESLEFCFEVITKGTELDGAVLKIEKIPVLAKCNVCSAEFNVENLVFACPECGSYDIAVLKGSEMQIQNIEIDD